MEAGGCALGARCLWGAPGLADQARLLSATQVVGVEFEGGVLEVVEIGHDVIFLSGLQSPESHVGSPQPVALRGPP